MLLFKNKSACGKPKTPQVGLGSTNPYENAININTYLILTSVVLNGALDRVLYCPAYPLLCLVCHIWNEGESNSHCCCPWAAPLFCCMHAPQSNQHINIYIYVQHICIYVYIYIYIQQIYIYILFIIYVYIYIDVIYV